MTTLQTSNLNTAIEVVRAVKSSYPNVPADMVQMGHTVWLVRVGLACNFVSDWQWPSLDVMFRVDRLLERYREENAE